MKALIRLCGCNRLICAFDVCKSIKQVFLWPCSIYFYCLRPGSWGGQKGTCSPPPPPPPLPTSQNNERVLFFLFIFYFIFFLPLGGLVGGGCMEIYPPPLTPTPSYPYSFVWVRWLKGLAGCPGFCRASPGNDQTSQNYFRSLELACIRWKSLVVCFYGPVNTI